MNRKTLISKNENCFVEDFNEVQIILQSETGKYHELNSIASDIFKIICKKPLTLDDLKLKLTEIYGDSFDQDELNNFIHDLKNRYIIDENPS